MPVPWCGAPTCRPAVRFLVDGKGENEIVVVSGANATLDRADVEIGRDSIEAAQIVLGQLEVSVAATLAAFRIAKAGSATTILNPAPADATIPEALWRCLDILTPNRLEAVRLAGGAADERPETIAREIVLLHGCAASSHATPPVPAMPSTGSSRRASPRPGIWSRRRVGA